MLEWRTGHSETRITTFDYTTPPSNVIARPGGLIERTRFAPGTIDEVITTTAYSSASRQSDLVAKVTVAVGTDVESDVEFTYDNNRNLRTSRNELDVETTFVFDDLDRKSKVTLPLPGTGDYGSQVTEYRYDLLSNLTHTIVSDPDGDGPRSLTDHEYQYDAMNRVERSFSPPAGGNPDSDQGALETIYTYDPNGNVKSVREGDSRTISYDYDRRNQQVRELYPSPLANIVSDVLPDPTEAEAYEAPQIERRYDELGNLRAESNPRTHFDGLNAHVFTTFQYDKLGRRVLVDYPQPTLVTDDAVVVTQYDDLGRVTDVFEPLATPTLSLGAVTTYAYDSLGRLVGQRQVTSGVV